jgi:hypothetical protein
VDESLAGEASGGAADIGFGDELDRIDLAACEIEVACFEPIAGKVGGAA